MQARLSRADTKLLWGAGLVGAFLVLATGLSVPLSKSKSPVPSSYSADPQGALAAYLLLAELHIPAQRFEEPPAMFSADPSQTVLIFAEPSEPANATDRKALLDFVTQGGRILYCGRGVDSFLPLPKTTAAPLADFEAFRPETPSSFSRGADEVSIQPLAAWDTSAWDTSKAESLELYGSSRGGPVVTVSRIGKGEVLWWSSATPLTNVGISLNDNLRLFMNAVSNPDGSLRNVYWDEYFHGQQTSLWSYIAATPLPWGMWQLALTAVVLMFTFSRRSGPIVSPRPVSRLSPLEFVDTMGDLYSRAGAASVAVAVPYQRLRLQLARKLGQSSATSDAELVKNAVQRHLSLDEQLLETLQTAAQAATVQKLPRSEALSLVQKLVGYSRQLSMPKLSGEPMATPEVSSLNQEKKT